jgi:hypothetical protein
MGNSESIAKKHYLMLREEDYQLAISGGAESGAVGGKIAVQEPVQHGAALDCTFEQNAQNSLENKADLRLSAQKDGSMHEHMEPSTYPQGESNPTEAVFVSPCAIRSKNVNRCRYRI